MLIGKRTAFVRSIALIFSVLFLSSAKAFVIPDSKEDKSPKVNTKGQLKTNVSAGSLDNISFKDRFGKIVELKDLKGKVIFLNFWATWCLPCLAEMPSIRKFYEIFKDDEDVVFILVDADGDLVKSQKYMDRKGFKLPVYTISGSISEDIFSGSLPTTVVFDKQGQVSYRGTGAANYVHVKFIDFIRKLKRN